MGVKDIFQIQLSGGDMKSPTALLKICVPVFLFFVWASSHAALNTDPLLSVSSDKDPTDASDRFSFEESTAHPSLLVDSKEGKCAIPLTREMIKQFGAKPEHAQALFESANKDADLFLNDLKASPEDSFSEVKLCAPDTRDLVLSGAHPSQYQIAALPPLFAAAGPILAVGTVYVGACMFTYSIGYIYVALLCAPVWAVFDEFFPMPKMR